MPDTEKVIATGYLRSYMRRDNPLAIIDGFKAIGHFLTLTESHLYVVKTTAPAFTKPILDNRGIECIALDKIASACFSSEGIWLVHPNGVLELEMKVKNKLFPTHETLINELARLLGIEERTSDFISQNKRRYIKKAGIILVAIIFAILWDTFTK